MHIAYCILYIICMYMIYNIYDILIYACIALAQTLSVSLSISIYNIHMH